MLFECAICMRLFWALCCVFTPIWWYCAVVHAQQWWYILYCRLWLWPHVTTYALKCHLDVCFGLFLLSHACESQQWSKFCRVQILLNADEFYSFASDIRHSCHPYSVAGLLHISWWALLRKMLPMLQTSSAAASMQPVTAQQLQPWQSLQAFKFTQTLHTMAGEADLELRAHDWI